MAMIPMECETINSTSEVLSNSILNRPSSYPSGMTSSNKNTWYYKIGSKVILNVGVYYTNTATVMSTAVTLFTLPTGYRPPTTLVLKACGYSFANNAILQVKTDGSVVATSVDNGIYGHLEFDAMDAIA